jgi:integrase
MPLGTIKFHAEDENAVVRYLSDDEEARLRGALVARDNARRAARESANNWRRERGYKEWAPYETYTDHITPLVLLALNTGLRRGELLQVRWRDRDLQRRILTVRGEGAKTRQTRHVPLNSEAARVMKVWRPTIAEPDPVSRFIFRTLSCSPRHRSSLNQTATKGTERLVKQPPTQSSGS